MGAIARVSVHTVSMTRCKSTSQLFSVNCGIKHTFEQFPSLETPDIYISAEVLANSSSSALALAFQLRFVYATTTEISWEPFLNWSNPQQYKKN